MIAAITGHRPDKLKSLSHAMDGLSNSFARLAVKGIIQGMAPGGDLLAARAAYVMNIPYEAVKPWINHRETIKDDYWLNQYDQAWQYAQKQTILSDATHYVGPWLYHNRNKYMVDNADVLIALWNGDPVGGTASTVKYAKGKKKRIYVVEPETGWCEWLQ